MTISSEISRLQTAKANMKTAIVNKGVSVADSVSLSNYCDCINAISSMPNERHIDVLVVGGGGGGGGGGSGGGGGAVIECIAYCASNNSYSVTIGAGGAGNVRSIGYSGCKGGTTIFGSIQAHGGGGGAGRPYGSGCATAGYNGGGGGMACSSACMYNCVQSKAGSYDNAGNPGMFGSWYCGYATFGGGGGGAGGSAYTECTGCGVCCKKPHGGKGRWSVITCSYYGGGGGGGNYNYSDWNGCGGCGGGGNHGYAGNSYGGGGGTYCAGYKGLVVVRYRTDGSSGIKCATGGTVTKSGCYTYHCFTTNGTFTIIG